MELTKTQTKKGRKEISMLNVFAGLGGGRLSAINAGLKVKTDYFSEVDKHAIALYQKRFPDAIAVGDVRQLKAIDFIHINIITGGSPCQNFSMMGRKKGMITTTNVEVTSLKMYMKLKKEGFEFVGQSYLFWEFVRLYHEIKALQIKMGLPVLDFLLENVIMTPKWEKIITEALGVGPILIDAARVSAQFRERLFWTSLKGVTVPEDKNIKLGDIIKGATSGCGYRGRDKYKYKGETREYYYPLSIRDDFKANTVLTSLGNTGERSGNGKFYGTGFYLTKKGDVKRLEVEHIEVLQCLEKGWTNIKGISNTQRIKMIGNAWCIGVTGHIMKFYK
jgi:hypothetical protein